MNRALFELCMDCQKLVIILFITILSSCADHEYSQDERIRLLQLQSVPVISYPSTNLYSEDKIKLGKLLFYDPILSGEKDIACVSCHHPSLGYADGVDLSIGPGGIGLGADRVSGQGRPYARRNSLTIINTGYNGLTNAAQEMNFLAPMTWTNVRRTLEAQTFGPLGDPAIMRGNAFEPSVAIDSITRRLKSIPEYQELFNNVFGGGVSSVTGENLGKAVAAFERSIISTNGPYDRYVNGNLSALSEQEKTGLLLFFGKANCATCHSGPLFSDYAIYNLGVSDNQKLVNPDFGNNKQRLFRTPSLRNVTLTAPYMHNGTIASLREVLDFYKTAGNENPASHNQVSIKIMPLQLSVEEINALLSFLETLTDDSYDKEIPSRVPSGLKPGGN